MTEQFSTRIMMTDGCPVVIAQWQGSGGALVARVQEPWGQFPTTAGLHFLNVSYYTHPHPPDFVLM